MPAKQGTNLFVTVSTRYDPQVHKDGLVCWTEEMFPDFHMMVREVGEDGTHPHYHIVGIASKEYRTDTVKTTLYTRLGKDRKGDPWTPEELKRSIVVKIHHDPVGCAGSYMSKEDTFEIVLLKGWTPEVLSSASQRVENYKASKKHVHCPASVAALRIAYKMVQDKISESPDYDLKWERMSVVDRFEMCKKIAMRAGYASLITLKAMERKEIIDNWFLLIEVLQSRTVEDYIDEIFLENI